MTPTNLTQAHLANSTKTDNYYEHQDGAQAVANLASLGQIEQLVIVQAHPDDAAYVNGTVLHAVDNLPCESSLKIVVATLTKGEAGKNYSSKYSSQDLATIRQQENINAFNALFSFLDRAIELEHIQLDGGDGRLAESINSCSLDLTNLPQISSNLTTVVVGFDSDLNGLEHDDHQASHLMTLSLAKHINAALLLGRLPKDINDGFGLSSYSQAVNAYLANYPSQFGDHGEVLANSKHAILAKLNATRMLIPTTWTI